MGDVYFARALAFADLIRTFCEAYTEENKDTPDMGISLPMTYAEAVPKVKRSTLYESYKQVLDDLEQAEKYIPANVRLPTLPTSVSVPLMRSVHVSAYICSTMKVP